MRAPRVHPFLDHEGPIAFAHRGGASAAPENTLLAFADAVQLGYRYVETDVQVTRDGRLVAFHDDNLLRSCGVDRRISEATWADVSTCLVDGREPIPLLEDVLGAWPTLRVNIDCKSDAALEPLVECLERTSSLDRVCLGSFSDKRLARLKATFGDKACISMGPRSVARLLAGSYLRPLGCPAADAAQIPLRQGPVPILTRALIDNAHRHGVAVHVWTIDDPTEMTRLIDLGVDGIMSDDTRALRDVFSARGLW